LDGQLLPGLKPAGVPRPLKDTSFPFAFNNLAEFQALLKKYQGRIAAVVAESVRNKEPETGFWEGIQEETRKNGIVLVIDEVSAGFRLNLGGAHLVYGVEPDIAVFAKGISNGYPMAAVIGKKECMDAAQDSFISSTYWTERIGPTAALASIDKMERCRVQEHLVAIGKQVQDGWNEAAKKTNLSIHVGSIYPMSHFDFLEGNPLALKTLFTQEMLERGYLAVNGFYSCYAHTDSIVQKYLANVEEVFALLKKSIEENTTLRLLKGPVCQSGFKRLN
jgi:glutamate-1-semialdehyde aminotransferase